MGRPAYKRLADMEAQRATTAAPERSAALTPAEMVAAARRGAPDLPDARPVRQDRSAMLSMRFRASSLANLAAAAREAGVTQKVFVASALLSAGVRIAPADLVDGSPARR